MLQPQLQKQQEQQVLYAFRTIQFHLRLDSASNGLAFRLSFNVGLYFLMRLGGQVLGLWSAQAEDFKRFKAVPGELQWNIYEHLALAAVVVFP